jgi:hypothetical protein
MTKTFTAALTALTLAATLALPSTQAEAKGGKNAALIGAGLLGAAVVGTAVAATAGPTVVVGPGFRRCHLVPAHNYFGQFVGYTKVCRYY